MPNRSLARDRFQIGYPLFGTSHRVIELHPIPLHSRSLDHATFGQSSRWLVFYRARNQLYDILGRLGLASLSIMQG